MVLAFCVVTMYNYHPWRLAKSNILKQYFSHGVNVVCDGSPSRMRRVLLISFGMTILPKSSTRRTIPVAFIYIPLLAVNSQWYCLQEEGNYAIFSCGRKSISRPVFANSAEYRTRSFLSRTNTASTAPLIPVVPESRFTGSRFPCFLKWCTSRMVIPYWSAMRFSRCIS